MTKPSGVMLAAAVLFMGLRMAAAAPPESWVATAKAACKGLTVGWTPTLAALQHVVGPRWRPAQGPVKGHGVLLLFATSCSRSRIGKTESGAFTLGAVIVPVENPADTHGIHQSNVHGWAVVPDALGPAASPVLQLFKRHAFAVTDAKVTLTIHSTAKGRRASMSFVTSKGRMQIHALVSGPAKRFHYVSALAGTDASIFSVFTGPESASRQAQGSAEVSTRGDTWVSRLNLDAKPKIVTLDQDFVWAFNFSKQPY